jgi:hypothetical protein
MVTTSAPLLRSTSEIRLICYLASHRVDIPLGSVGDRHH